MIHLFDSRNAKASSILTTRLACWTILVALGLATHDLAAQETTPGDSKDQTLEQPATQSEETKATSGEVQEEPDQRSEIPNEAAQAEADKLLESIYRSELGNLDTRFDRIRLSRRFIQDAKTTDNDSLKYALLDQGRKLALQSDDAVTGLDAVAQLETDFRIDGAKLRFQAYRNIPRVMSTKDASKVINAIRLDMITRIHERDFDSFFSLLNFAKLITKNNRMTDLSQRLSEVEKLTTKIQHEYERGLEAKKKADSDSILDREEGHTDYGYYLCAIAGDWNSGLEHLSKGSDKQLAKLAFEDLAEPVDSLEMFELAERWKQYASNGRHKLVFALRAYYWYQQAQFADVEGLIGKKAAENIKPVRNVLWSAWPLAPKLLAVLGDKKVLEERSAVGVTGNLPDWNFSNRPDLLDAD